MQGARALSLGTEPQQVQDDDQGGEPDEDAGRLRRGPQALPGRAGGRAASPGRAADNPQVASAGALGARPLWRNDWPAELACFPRVAPARLPGLA